MPLLPRICLRSWPIWRRSRRPTPMPGATATRWATYGCAIVATRPRPFKRAGDPPPSMGGDMTDDELLEDNAAERAQAAALRDPARAGGLRRSEEHTSELPALMRTPYA